MIPSLGCRINSGVTLSKEVRIEKLDEAILFLMSKLHGRSILEVFIQERYLDHRILPSTWDELKRRHLVRETNGQSIYTLSGPGWIAGLKLCNEFDTPELRATTGRLCAALKGRVKGREYRAIAHVDELAADSGVPAAFIRNAIESDLIGQLFNVIGADWVSHRHRATMVSIPRDFGMELL